MKIVKSTQNVVCRIACKTLAIEVQTTKWRGNILFRVKNISQIPLFRNIGSCFDVLERTDGAPKLTLFLHRKADAQCCQTYLILSVWLVHRVKSFWKFESSCGRNYCTKIETIVSGDVLNTVGETISYIYSYPSSSIIAFGASLLLYSDTGV